MKKYNPKDTLIIDKLLKCKRTVSFISTCTNSDFTAMWKKVVKLRKLVSKWIKNSGIKHTAAKIKDLEKSYLLGKSHTWLSIKHFSGLGISVNGVKTLLTIHRKMTCFPEPDLNSIKHKGGDVDAFWSKYQDSIEHDVLKRQCFNLTPFEDPFFLRNQRWGKPFPKSEYNPYTADPTVDCNNRTGGRLYPLRVNLKGGPNGPHLFSHSKDLCGLKKQEPHLLPLLKEIWKEWLYDFNPDMYPQCAGDCQCLASKLLCIRDKSCKTRIVAMLDSFSQVALRPFHVIVEELLKKNFSDFTHNHVKGVSYLKTLGGELSSIDLSNATDCIPADLSFKILGSILNPNIVKEPQQLINNIKSVMTDRWFYYTTKAGLDKIRYSAGQPMGAYASFPLLAITNHFLVHLAHSLTYPPVGGYDRDGVCGFYGDVPRKRKFTKYAVVGDDVVIGDRKVADLYIQLLEELNIPVNHTKMITGYRTFEFCKRILLEGNLVSVPSWNSYFESIRTRDPGQILILLKDYEMVIPSYPLLLRYFERSALRTLLAFHDLAIVFKPKITAIPDNVRAHAERVMTIIDSLKNGYNEVKTDDPFLSRLNYGKTILDVFKSKSKKLRPWDLALQVKANTFYLGYSNTYLNYEKLKIHAIYTSRYHENSKRKKLRQLCMSKRKVWDLLS